MITKLITALKERANLFRAQMHPGTNIFDQAAGMIERQRKEIDRLTKELTFSENMLKMMGAIELEDIPEDAIEVGVVTDPMYVQATIIGDRR